MRLCSTRLIHPSWLPPPLINAGCPTHPEKIRKKWYGNIDWIIDNHYHLRSFLVNYLVPQVSQKITANAPKAAHQTHTPTPPQRINSSELLAGGKRLVIEHRGVSYILQVTRSGKLILTK